MMLLLRSMSAAARRLRYEPSISSSLFIVRVLGFVGIRENDPFALALLDQLLVGLVIFGFDALVVVRRLLSALARELLSLSSALSPLVMILVVAVVVEKDAPINIDLLELLRLDVIADASVKAVVQALVLQRFSSSNQPRLDLRIARNSSGYTLKSVMGLLPLHAGS